MNMIGMTKYKIWVIIALIVFLGRSHSFAGILPYPNHIEWKSGEYRMGRKAHLYCDACFKEEVRRAMDGLDKAGLLSYDFCDKSGADFRICYTSEIKPEGYMLDINSDGITICASTQSGVFYAIQTLRQVAQEEGASILFPCMVVCDYPAFAWRGFLLDEARNFQGKSEVKKLLDEMAALKMNVFQWHLTDDQGWRIEIKKYPLLTAVGGHRDSTQLDWYESTVYDGTPVSEFYTQDDIREIVAYAADRHITVVPEIEFPGHASAAIAAYPWLGCSQDPISVPCSYGVFSAVFNIADSRVQTFIRDVLDEVSSLFPSAVIHIGGDEVKYDEWQNSQAIQQLMEKEQLSTPAELQIWFANRLSSYLSRKGKIMMGWNDITGDKLHAFQPDSEVQSKLDPANTIVQFWTGDRSILKKALERRLKIVNTLCEYTYLNYNYDKIVPGLEYGYKPISLEKAYDFNPVPEWLESDRDLILGLSCAMWGEWINRPETMYKMVYPQIAAYAETGWTLQENKNFDRFQRSLRFFIDRWQAARYIQ